MTAAARSSGPAFSATLHVQQGAVIIRVVGELDHDAAPVLAEQLDQAQRVAGTPVLIVDTAKISFCDSDGLNTLIVAALRAKDTGIRMMFSGVHGTLARMLSLTGLTVFFEIHPSTQDALHASMNQG